MSREAGNMAEQKRQEHGSEHHQAHHAERSEQYHAQHEPSPVEATHAQAVQEATAPSYPSTLLNDPRLKGRGNGSVRTALMLQMQQTYGNRAVQRFLQQSRAVAVVDAFGTPGKAKPSSPVAPKAQVQAKLATK